MLDFICGLLISVLVYKLVVDAVKFSCKSLAVDYNDKIQKIFMYQFITGLAIFSIIYIIRHNSSAAANAKSIIYGFYLGALFLIFEAVIIYWNVLSDDTHLILIGFALILILLCALRMKLFRNIIYEQRK